jgi:hypothetical protein
MGTVVESCFSKNSTNSERFAECLIQTNKKVEDIMKSLEFKMLFFSKSANGCLSKKRTVSDCTDEASKGIREMISSTKSIIDKI